MKEEWKQLLADYLKTKKRAGASEQSIIGSRNRIPRLYRYLEKEGLELDEVGLKEAQAYQGSLFTRSDGKRYSTETVSSYMKAATSFFEYLRKKGKVVVNPFKEFKKIRVEKKLPRDILKEKDMAVLLEEFKNYDKRKGLKSQIAGYRMHVIAELMYSTGLRINEVADLRPEDVELSCGLVRVREGKGSASRICFLNEYAEGVLRLYMEKMRGVLFNEWNDRNRGLLFGMRWQSFSKMVNKELKKVALGLGLPAMRSHGFRHALGYHLLRAGCNIRHIQTILGHKAIKNTEVYTKVDKEGLKEVLDRHHPRTWRKKNEKG